MGGLGRGRTSSLLCNRRPSLSRETGQDVGIRGIQGQARGLVARPRPTPCVDEANEQAPGALKAKPAGWVNSLTATFTTQLIGRSTWQHRG